MRRNKSSKADSAPGSVICSKCGKSFRPLDTPEADLIRRAAKAGYKQLNVDCAHCKRHTAINPVAVVAGKNATETASVICQKCGGTFQPLEAPHADLVHRAAKARYKELGIECPLCADYTKIDPVAVAAGKDGTVVSEPMYRCPVSGCTGWVNYVRAGRHKRPFWGCGECGSIWHRKAKLLSEIDKIIKKFPYRRKCYRKSKGAWHPADPDRIPDDYDERVEAEPQDERNDFVRG
jgi:hypothetical protein